MEVNLAMDTDKIIHVLLSNIGEYKTFRTTTVDVFLEDPQYYHQMVQQKRIDEECQKVLEATRKELVETLNIENSQLRKLKQRAILEEYFTSQSNKKKLSQLKDSYEKVSVNKLIVYLYERHHTYPGPKKTIVDVFLNFKYFYSRLVSDRKIDPKAHVVLYATKTNLEATQNIRSESKRTARQKKILNDYIRQHDLNNIVWVDKDKIIQKPIESHSKPKPKIHLALPADRREKLQKELEQKRKEECERLNLYKKPTEFVTPVKNTAKPKPKKKPVAIHGRNANLESKSSTSKAKRQNVPVSTDLSEIKYKDFVVRSTTMRCTNRQHHIENIQAVVTVITPLGDLVTRQIPASYCRECNVYFLMENTYTKLKTIGIPFCRVTDHETWIKQNTGVGCMKLAKESVLMQYGYNVSQKEDLSSMQRQTILQSIVENGILSKSEVVSYLNYFINQRINRDTDMYDVAISKWREDRDFILYSDLGIPQRVFGIKSITKR